jgi:hypothetical protein
MVVQELDIAWNEIHIEPQVGVACQFGRIPHKHSAEVCALGTTKLGRHYRGSEGASEQATGVAGACSPPTRS